MDTDISTRSVGHVARVARWSITMTAVTALLIAVLLPAGPAAANPPARWSWPIEGTHQVTRVFDPPAVTWGSGHRGVDIAGAASAPVYAAGAGTVTYAGVLAGRGVVAILHSGGLKTTYEPVTASVAVGTSVAGGQQIGTLEAGHPGCPVAACLHWGLRRGEVYLDPLSLLRPRKVRLLPRN